MGIKPLNIFYEEPDPDRWFQYDRYPRKIIRRIVRGRTRPGGVMMVALELMRGLDKLGVPYRFNDYKYVKKNPHELIGVIGKPHLIFQEKFSNPILFGAGVFSHPLDCLDLFQKYPNVKKILVPGPWMKEMFFPYYGDFVESWPVGIDTEKWRPNTEEKDYDFLIYQKLLWNREKKEEDLIKPVLEKLRILGLNYQVIKYGYYNHEELQKKLKKSQAVLFFCEHETQGLAYQQILSTGTPILSWDGDGFWQDTSYYPHKIGKISATSTPYWDDRCGLKFKNLADFDTSLFKFQNQLHAFNPRAYILENLTLEKCAMDYVKIVEEVQKAI